MRFSTFHVGHLTAGSSATETLQGIIDDAVLADQLGFDTCWVAEHHFTPYGTVGWPAVVLSAIAMRTANIKLGSGIAVLPLHHPLRVAEDLAVVDVLSGGRLIAGVGPGLAARDFHGFGIDMDERRGRFIESLEILRQCWTEPEVRFAGQHWQINGVSILPKPVQQPHPPLVIAATKPESQAAAARASRPILIGRLGDDFAYESLHYYVGIRREEGHSEAEISRALELCGVLRHISIDLDRGRAYEQAIRAAETYIALSDDLGAYPPDPGQASREAPADFLERGALVGTPDDIMDHLDALHAIGVRHIICSFDWGGLDRQTVQQTMKLFAREVFPLFAPIPTLAG